MAFNVQDQILRSLIRGMAYRIARGTPIATAIGFLVGLWLMSLLFGGH